MLALLDEDQEGQGNAPRRQARPLARNSKDVLALIGEAPGRRDRRKKAVADNVKVRRARWMIQGQTKRLRALVRRFNRSGRAVTAYDLMPLPLQVEARGQALPKGSGAWTNCGRRRSRRQPIRKHRREKWSPRWRMTIQG